jgi:putative ABC transport system permease protein
MMRLALGALRRHRGIYLGTFLASVLAIALLAGGGLLLFSVLTAKPPADRFAAAAVVVSGDRAVTVRTVTSKKDKLKTKAKSESLTGPLPTGLVGRLDTLPGVAAAVPDAAFPVVLTTTTGRVLTGTNGAPVIGHGWGSARLTPFTLRSGAPPVRGEVVLDADLAGRAGVAAGARVVITSKTGIRTVRVAGIAAPAGRDALAAQAALFLAEEDVPVVSGLAGPTAVGILATPGADRAALAAAVRARAGGAAVLTGADRTRADLPGALPDYIGPISIFGFVIGITGFAAVFVLISTVALGARQRLRELALLRTTGATPGQLRRLLTLESIAIGVLAALPGCPAGVVIAHLIAARFRALKVVPAQFVVRDSVPVLAAAALGGVLVTLIAARIASRRAVRIAPTQALAETAVEPRGGVVLRVLTAAASTGGAITVLTFVPLNGPFGLGMGFISCALLLCAVAVLGPVLIRPLTALVSRLAGIGGVNGRLAAAISRAETRRVAAVSVPLVLMFAINATMLLNTSLLNRLAADQQAERQAPATAQASGRTGIPLPEAREIAEVSGVTGAAATLPTRVVVVKGGKPQHYAAQGLLIAGDQQALDLRIGQGALGGEATFAASDLLAHDQGWRIGDEVPVWLADGYRVKLRLSAVYGLWRGFGDLALPAQLVADHDPRGLVATIALRYQGDAADRIARSWPGLRITPATRAAPAGDAQNQQGAWELLVVITVGFTAIAVVNTFAIAAAARRREYADLRLAGATAGQIHRLAGREAGIAVSVALLLGGAVTTIVTGAFTVAQGGPAWLPDPVTAAVLVAGVAALGLVAGAVPARFVVRRRSLPQIADVS